MVDIVDEENYSKLSIHHRKKTWALWLYSFSISKNFDEIFFKPSKTIKDKKFEVFHGIKFLMMNWVILGNTYFLGNYYGNSSRYLVQ